MSDDELRRPLLVNTRTKMIHLDSHERWRRWMARAECGWYLEFWDAQESATLPTCKRCAKKASER